MWQKLLFILLVVIIGVVISLGVIARNRLKTGVERQLRSLHGEIVSVVAQEINTKLENTHAMLVATANIPGIREYKVKTIETIFKSLLSNFRIFTRMSLIDKNGKVIFSTLQDSEEKTGKIWYSTIIKGNYNSRYVSDLNFISGNIPTISMAVPLRDKHYGITGILVTDLDLFFLKDIVKRIKIGKKTNITITNSKGICICHSNDATKIGKEIEEYFDIFKNEVTEFSGESGDNVISAISLTNFKPEPDLGRYSPIDWKIFLSQNKGEAYAESMKLNDEFFKFAILSVIIAFPISIFLALTFTKHLKALKIDAERLSIGELDQPVMANSCDEIGDLALVFEEMRVNLKKKMSDLKLLYDVGQKISSVLEISDLLKLILSKNIEILDADRGSLMLFDEETGYLKIEVQEGLTAEITERQTDINAGVAGKVYRTGKALLIKDALKSDELRELKGDGEIYPGTLLSVPLTVKDRIIGVLNVSKSIPCTFNEGDLELFTALSAQGAIAIDNAILYKLAITDGMTKLYLHRYFQQRLDQEIIRSRRYGYRFSLIMIDIDHFKLFNDNYGHQNGDRVLKIVAKIFTECVREVDIPARYGGEEFCVICPEIPISEAEIPAERIRKAIEDHKFFIGEKEVPIRISIGVSGWPEDATEKLDLIDKADKALYTSKERGRNIVSMYHKIDQYEKNSKNKS